MEIPRLTTGDSGDDVARLHERLKLHGLEVSPEERERRFFGPSTRAAVSGFQKIHGIEPSGEVQESTADRLSSQPLAAGAIPPNPELASARLVIPGAGGTPSVSRSARSAPIVPVPFAPLESRPAVGGGTANKPPVLQPIIATIKPGESGPQVANLQDALSLLVERGRLTLDDPAVKEKLLLAEGLKRDRQSFGDSGTLYLVRIFQAQQQLNVTGEVDTPTAAATERYLARVGRADGDHDCRARPGHSSRQADPICSVRAFDQDLRKQQLLGTATTDTAGRYEIHYRRAQFARAERGTAELIVRAFRDDSAEEPLAESQVRINVGDDATVDLTVPAPAVSEWERIRDAVLPLLDGQGESDDQPLPPGELNDRDIDFIVDETGLDREHVRLWVLAARTAHDETFLGLTPSAPNLLRARVNTTPASAAVDDAMEFIAFYGWFRQGLPTDWEAFSTATDQHASPGAARRDRAEHYSWQAS